MFSQSLIAGSAAILFVLGAAHLYLTFFRTSLEPRDAALREQMATTHLRLTRQTTVWRAWLGFNASHSVGVMLFGLVYGYLALCQTTLLMQSHFLLGLGAVVLIAYLGLAHRYWFRIPLVGCALALALYSTGIFLSFAGR